VSRPSAPHFDIQPAAHYRPIVRDSGPNAQSPKKP
jgi:hypothetical protein